MLDAALAKVFGTKHDREIKRIRPLVSAINDLEPQMMALSDAELAAKTVDFKQRVLSRQGIWQPLHDSAFFKQCRFDAELQTIVWPNGADLCPDVVIWGGLPPADASSRAA